MNHKRQAGILCHISSLPNNFGIGDFGPSAYNFVDFLHECHQHIWQILPLTITQSITGNSPYSSVSAFALNPIFVSPEVLCGDGFIDEEAMKQCQRPCDSSVNYKDVYAIKDEVLKRAYATFQSEKKWQEEFESFVNENQFWLDDYCLYRIFKDKFLNQAWSEWPQPYSRRDPSALQEIKQKEESAFKKYAFVQFVLFRQWKTLKDYANTKGIKVFGDLPIYVEFDSVDVWSHSEIFMISYEGKLEYVAGVPPDYFSKTGQRWGNPVYDWRKLKETEFDWWIKRLEHSLTLFDLTRVDHFRGLVAYWQIPAKDKTALNGKWVTVPVESFMQAVQRAFPAMPFIAEDLGYITKDVTDVMEKYHLPGMKILQFAFSEDLKSHPYLPHNYDEQSFTYTGTHDNNTTRGWYIDEASPQEKANLREYMDENIDKNNIHWNLMELAYHSPSMAVIIPMQDILGLGSSARMNTPGKAKGNWEWRISQFSFGKEIQDKLKRLLQRANRL